MTDIIVVGIVVILVALASRSSPRIRATRRSWRRKKTTDTISAPTHISSTIITEYIHVRHCAICELWSSSTMVSRRDVDATRTEARLSTALLSATRIYSWARRLSPVS